MSGRDWTRREWLGAATAGAALGPAAWSRAAGKGPRGRAEACIMLWLGGGPAQIDTFDPKRKGDGKKVAGSYYDKIPTAVRDVELCSHLPKLADRLDRCAVVRTLHHDVIDEHGAATNIVHTGRPTSETIAYPSVGSVVAHERGAAAEGVPAYVVIGYPNVSRGPGFLGSKAGYIYLTDTQAGPTGLTPPARLSDESKRRRERLLEAYRGDFAKRHSGEPTAVDYVEASREAARLAGPAFRSVFDLASEPASLREGYGGEFGQRCLLARRLVESGVRFVEVAHNLNFVNGTGWDTHNAGQLHQHELIIELDNALSALIDDLERRKKLDTTLIVVAGEFGRPPEFDAGGGRGHQSTAFSALLAGGGLATGKAIGRTDDLAKTIAERPVSIPDFHATIHSALGIDPDKELRTSDGRPVPITDHGKPIAELFT
ncbi:MAG: DUF1501 domain-containing protein [Isosphaeraceae bacterium]|nr:DUF1501 domain-containing protein [Isosphaeraceae bacterium]